MKLALRIFNVIIMAISAFAVVALFASPTLSLNSHIAIDVPTIAKFVPETEYTQNVDIAKLLGTDAIHFGLKFSLSPLEAKEMMNGKKEVVDEQILDPNLEDLIEIMHEPFDLIAEYTIRSVLTSTIKAEVTNAIDDSVQEAQAKGIGTGATTEEIMEEVGMDDTYFKNFSNALYAAANSDTATVDSVSEVLYQQIDEALAMAEESGGIDTSSFGEDTKATVKSSMLSILNQLELVEEGGKIKKLSEISYSYLAKYLKQQLDGKVSEEELTQGTTETTSNYVDRLLKVYVKTIMPAVFYQVIGYICFGLFVGMFLFAIIWGLLFLITLIKTFFKKPWTFFGPIFWLIGPLQIVLGIGLTIAFKFVIPNTIKLTELGLPISTLVLAPRSYALIPSILFVVSIVIAIVYGFFKRRCKEEIMMEKRMMASKGGNPHVK